MKAIKLFSILSITSICGIINCTEENFQVYSIVSVDKDNLKQNFNYQNKDSNKYLVETKELSLLVKKIQSVCEIIETAKNNKNEYTLDEEIYKIVRMLDKNSYQSLKYFKCDRLFKGLDISNILIKNFLILFEKKQDENNETVLFKSIKNVVYELQDLNALSKVAEKLFDKEKGESEASNDSYRIRKELEDLHYLIKKICRVNSIYSSLSFKKCQFFNDEKKELLFKFMNDAKSLKNIKQLRFEIKMLQAKTCHKNIIDFFWKYILYLEEKKRKLNLIIKSFSKICRCKENIGRYLELLKMSLNKN